MIRLTPAAFSIACALLLSTVFSDEIEFRFATLAPKSSAWGRAISRMVPEIYKETGKTVRIKVFYGGQMGDESEMVDKIQYGQLEGGAFTGNGLGKSCPEVRVLEIPGLFSSGKQVDAVYEKIEPELQKYFNKRKLALISLSETGFAYFFSKKDVSSVDDIRKTKMWLWKGDRLVNQFMDHLKIPAVPVNFPEVISSLQTGLIDGFYVTPTAGLSLQWTSEARYMLDMPITSVTGGLILSLDAWNKLSQAQKDTVTRTAKKFVRELTLANRASDAQSIELLKQGGLVVRKSKDPADLMYRSGVELEKKVVAAGIVPGELITRVRALAAEAK